MPGRFELAAQDVDIWQVHLIAEEEMIKDCRKLLAADEIQRADRFHFERDRKRFLIARAAMRNILARYVNIPAKQLIFSYGEKGKPELANPITGIQFNLSHSGDFALLAVTRNACLGVDIEFMNQEFAAYEIATRFFSQNEISTFLKVPDSERARAFFHCWTRKEAYIKAVGEGLSIPLDSFDVAFGPDVSPCLLRVKASPDEPARWSMYDLAAPPGYAAALVVEGNMHQLKQQQWQLLQSHIESSSG
jgi:4'-phosphopantetheinyl transferase